MKKYFSILGLVLVLIYGLWVWSAHTEVQNCTAFLCGKGAMRSLVPALFILIPLDLILNIESPTIGYVIITFAYIANVAFYYSLGLWIGRVFNLKAQTNK